MKSCKFSSNRKKLCVKIYYLLEIEIVSFCNCHNSFHVARLTHKVHRHNGLRLGRDGIHKVFERVGDNDEACFAAGRALGSGGPFATGGSGDALGRRALSWGGGGSRRLHIYRGLLRWGVLLRNLINRFGRSFKGLVAGCRLYREPLFAIGKLLA